MADKKSKKPDEQILISLSHNNSNSAFIKNNPIPSNTIFKKLNSNYVNLNANNNPSQNSHSLNSSGSSYNKREPDNSINQVISGKVEIPSFPPKDKIIRTVSKIYKEDDSLILNKKDVSHREDRGSIKNAESEVSKRSIKNEDRNELNFRKLLRKEKIVNILYIIII
jgi:hypothetical protein